MRHQKSAKCWEHRLMYCVQNTFCENSRTRYSVTLEWEFFASCVNSFELIVVTEKEDEGKCQRGFLRKCESPAWQRFPGGIERQERKGAVPGQGDGKDREGRESNRGHKQGASFTSCGGKETMVPLGSDPSYAWHCDVKASVYNAR